MRTQTNFENLEDEDPQISYMISSWARMCKILGKDFEKYLPVVMGPVLKTASFKPEIAVVDGKLFFVHRKADLISDQSILFFDN